MQPSRSAPLFPRISVLFSRPRYLLGSHLQPFLKQELPASGTCIIRHPTQRATAGGWVLLGFELGPALGRRSFHTWSHGQLPKLAYSVLLPGLARCIRGHYLKFYAALLPETAPDLGHQGFVHASLTSRGYHTVRELNPLRVLTIVLVWGG